MTREKALKLRSMIEKASESLNDDDALEVVELFKVWYSGISYVTDERVRYGDKLYRCVQAHTSQADWEPDRTPALWTEVAKPGEIPVWKQPTGAQDAYAKGDKVWYPEKDTTVYVSLVDANVWQPTTPGLWEVVET